MAAETALLQHVDRIGRVDVVLEDQHDDLVGVLPEVVVDDTERVDGAGGAQPRSRRGTGTPLLVGRRTEVRLDTLGEGTIVGV